MAKGIAIGVAADTRDYATGIQRGVIEPTEDAQRALDDVGRTGDHAGGQLHDSMRTAQRSTEELKTELGQLSGEVRAASSGSKQIGTKFKAATDEAGEGVETLKENTASNLKEVAASFDGTAQGMVGGVQGLVAEVLEGFGPGGLIAGAVLAGGIGLIMSGIEQSDEQTQQWKEDVASLAQTWIDAGRNGQVSAQQIVDGLKGMATQTDANKVSLADVQQQAKQLGVPFRELAQHVAAGGDATQYAIDRLDGLIDKNKSLLVVSRTAARSGIGETGRANAATAERIAALEKQRNKLKDVAKETAAAAREEADWIAAGGPELEAKAAATDNYANSIQGALEDAGANWEDYKTKEGGINLTKYNKMLEDKAASIRKYQANINIASGQMSDQALQYIESLGVDAAPLLQAFVDAPKSQQDRLAANWDTLGRAASSSYTAGLKGALPDSITGPRVDLQTPDPSAMLEGLRRHLGREPLQVEVAGYLRNGKRVV